MTSTEVIAHWRKGASDAFEVAQLIHKDGKYALALFHCHLAVEKALKAMYIKEYNDMPPKVHDSLFLARKLKRSWTTEEEDALDELSDYAAAARYCDFDWEQVSATQANSKRWLAQSKIFLSALSAL